MAALVSLNPPEALLLFLIFHRRHKLSGIWNFLGMSKYRNIFHSVPRMHEMLQFRGSDDEKKTFSIHLREKYVKQNIISMSSHPKFVSRLFLKNVNKTNCIENIRILGVLQKIFLLLQFHRYNKIDELISFTNTIGAGRYIPCFLNFWKIKIWEANKFFFFKKSHFLHIFFLCWAFLLERDRKRKN